MKTTARAGIIVFCIAAVAALVWAWFAATGQNAGDTGPGPAAKGGENVTPVLPEGLDWHGLPIAAEKTAVITAKNGGAMEFADGSGVLIPPGALPADAKVVLRRRTIPGSHAGTVTLTDVDVGDATLSADATLSLPLPPSDPHAAGTYKVYHVHEGTPTEVAGQLHPYRRQIQVRTRTFSSWIVIWDPHLKEIMEHPLLWVDPQARPSQNSSAQYWAVFIFQSPGKADVPVVFKQYTEDYDREPARQNQLARQTAGKDDEYAKIHFSPLAHGEMVRGYKIGRNEPSHRQLCGGFAISPLTGGPYLFPTPLLWSAVKEHATVVTSPRAWDLILFSSDGPIRDLDANGNNNLGHYALVESVGPGDRVNIITKNQVERIYRGPLSDFEAQRDDRNPQGERLLGNSMASEIVGSDNPAVKTFYRLDWNTVTVRRGPSLELSVEPKAPVKPGQIIRGFLKIVVRDIPAACAAGNELRVRFFLQAGGTDGVMTDMEIPLKIDPTLFKKNHPNDPDKHVLKSQEFQVVLEDKLPLEVPASPPWAARHAPNGRVPVVAFAYFLNEKLDDGRLIRTFESPSSERSGGVEGHDGTVVLFKDKAAPSDPVTGTWYVKFRTTKGAFADVYFREWEISKEGDQYKGEEKGTGVKAGPGKVTFDAATSTLQIECTSGVRDATFRWKLNPDLQSGTGDLLFTKPKDPTAYFAVVNRNPKNLPKDSETIFPPREP